MPTGQSSAKPRRAPASPAQAPAQQRSSSRRSATDTGKPGRPVLHALHAAEEAVTRETVQIRLPVVGELRLPSREDLAFLGGVAVLTAIGVLEWPVALLLGVGHELATNRHDKLLKAFGEALEAA